MRTVKERVEYLPLLIGHYVKTPSTAGGMWFSFRADEAKTDPEKKEIESIGKYLGVQTLTDRVVGPDGERKYISFEKAVVDFTYRELNNGYETFEPEEIIPILRPLHSITNQECLELAVQEGYDRTIIRSRPEAIISNIKSIFSWKSKDLMLSPTMTIWLARRGFDVTGWIDEGLALNSTKMQLPIMEVS